MDFLSRSKRTVDRRRQSTTSRSVERAAAGKTLLQKFHDGVQKAGKNEDQSIQLIETQQCVVDFFLDQ